MMGQATGQSGSRLATARRLRRRAAGVVLTLLTLAVLFAHAPALVRWDRMDLGNADWFMHYTLHRYLRVALLEYGQFPLWCPYLGGGLPIHAHPEFPSLNPLALWSVLAGELAGVKLAVLSYHLLGLASMFWYTRRALRWRLVSAAAASACYTCSLWVTDKAWSGNVNELHIVCLPAVLGLHHLYVTGGDRRHALAAAVVVAWMATDGKYAPAVAVLCLAMFAVAEGIGRRQRMGRRLGSLAAIALLAAGLSAVKAYPTLRFMRFHGASGEARLDSRPAGGRAVEIAPDFALRSLTMPAARPSHAAGFAYVGWPCLALAVATAATGWRAQWRRGCVWLVLLAIYTGLRYPLPLAWAIHRLPLLDSMGAQQKYFGLPLILASALLCGRFFSLAWVRRRRRLAGLCLAAVAASAVYGSAVGQKRMAAIASDAVPPPPSSGRFFQVEAAGDAASPPMLAQAYFAMQANVGVRSWNSSVYFPRRVVSRFQVSADNRPRAVAGYRGEAYALDPANSASLAWVRGGLMRVECRLASPDVVVVNQNFHPSWRSSVGEVVNVEGVLGVRLPAAGAFQVDLRFEPWDVTVGLAVTLITAAVGVLWSWRLRLLRRPSGELCRQACVQSR